MFNNSDAGAKGFPAVVAGAQHEEVSADLRALTRKEIYKNTPFFCDFDGGNTLPSAIIVLETGSVGLYI